MIYCSMSKISNYLGIMICICPEKNLVLPVPQETFTYFTAESLVASGITRKYTRNITSFNSFTVPVIPKTITIPITSKTYLFNFFKILPPSSLKIIFILQAYKTYYNTFSITSLFVIL